MKGGQIDPPPPSPQEILPSKSPALLELKASAFHQLIKKPLEDKNIFIPLLPTIRVAEIVECVCKDEDGISPKLISVSPY